LNGKPAEFSVKFSAPNRSDVLAHAIRNPDLVVFPQSLPLCSIGVNLNPATVVKHSHFHKLDEANAWSDNPVGAFDFPLRWRLRDLCDGYGFSLRNLTDRGVLMCGRPAQAVTFVENHDVVRDTPIFNDKLLAYAFILTHEGYPCVFWQDYFNWDLAQPNNRSGINALIKVHEQNAVGATQVLFLNGDLYIMQRLGNDDQSGDLRVKQQRQLERHVGSNTLEQYTP